MIKLSHFFWIFPFIACAFGYYIVRSFFYVSEVSIPNVIGKSLQEGVALFSDATLNMRLLKEKESDIAQGTILDQKPAAGKTARPNSPVFVIVSKQPKKPRVPEFVGMKASEIVHSSARDGISTRIFRLKSLYPSGVCFSQYPAAPDDLGDTSIVSYVSSGLERLIVVPAFERMKVKDIQGEFEREDVHVECVHNPPLPSKHICKKCVVVEQRPLAGSIIDGSKKIYVQLLVEKQR